MKCFDNVNLCNRNGTNCYILRGTDGDILIDTGVEEERENIEKWLDGYDVRLIILTHGHFDHAGNAAYFARKYNAKIAMSRYDYRLSQGLVSHTLYPVSPLGAVFAKFTNMSSSAGKGNDTFKADVFLCEGDTLDEYGVDAMVVDLQGHTRGSIGILYGDDLYAGDAVVNVYYPATPAIAESPRHTYKTVEYIKNLRPTRIMPGHGMPFDFSSRKITIL